MARMCLFEERDADALDSRTGNARSHSVLLATGRAQPIAVRPESVITNRINPNVLPAALIV
jgi:hypothetical protein